VDQHQTQAGLWLAMLALLVALLATPLILFWP
jgi:hypothetical protein